MKKRTARILYMNVSAILTVVGLYLFRKNVQSTDKNFNFEVLVSIVLYMLVYGIIHYLFMKLIFDKYDEK